MSASIVKIFAVLRDLCDMNQRLVILLFFDVGLNVRISTIEMMGIDFLPRYQLKKYHNVPIFDDASVQGKFYAKVHKPKSREAFLIG